MSITVLFRLAMGLALAGAVGIGYARSRRMEAGEPRGDDRKDAVVYGDPNTVAFMIAAFPRVTSCSARMRSITPFSRVAG